MADNIAITAGSGTTVATDDVGSAHYQKVKIVWGPNNTINETDDSAGARVPIINRSAFVTVSTDVVLPTSSVYAINDTISDSTSAPVSGGYTFTSCARVSGGSGIITDAIITSSADPATSLQGEVWIFDTAVTNINDNSPFVVSDSEIKTLVGVIPFTMSDSGNNNSAWVSNLNMGFTTVGNANLRFLIRAKNGYTPATDTLTFRLKIMQLD
jgi:hypothetical protein